GTEVKEDGDAEADDRSQAEHQEGSSDGAAATDDRAPAGLGSKGHGPPGRAGSSPRRQARSRTRGSDTTTALRRGQEAEHPRSFEDGEVGPRESPAQEQVGRGVQPRGEGSSPSPRPRSCGGSTRRRITMVVPEVLRRMSTV